ncbi:MAG: GtrA family protein [Treponema sp.]|nr:GtrA family protein [Treponema sp.]
MFLFYNCLQLNYWVSSASNYAAGSILSFFLNKYFTFSVKKWRLSMVILFICNILICYFMAYGIAKPFVGGLMRNYSQKWRDNSAMFAGMVLFTGLNYLGQKYLVFRNNNHDHKN